MPSGMSYSSMQPHNAEQSAQIAQEFQNLGQNYQTHRMDPFPTTNTTHQGHQGQQQQQNANRERDASQFAPTTRISAQDIDAVAFETSGPTRETDEEMEDA